MISLNLISPEQKNDLRYEYIYLSLRTLVWMVLSVTIMLSAIFISARLMLENNYVTVVQQLTMVNQKNLGLDQEINKINLSLKEVASIQKEFVKWSNFLIELTRAIPSNIIIASLNIEKSNMTINIQGQAQTREDFLKLKENLESLSYLSEVSSPISNLLTKTNVEFQLTAKINLLEFNKL